MRTWAYVGIRGEGFIREHCVSFFDQTRMSHQDEGTQTVKSDASEEERSLIGQVLDGKYRVVRLLGKGGMGVVVEAENLLIERRVAVKLLHANLADNDVAVERFHREAVAAASTGHDHIVDILDLGTPKGGSPFIVMELLAGRTLQDLLKELRILDYKRASRIAIQALSALSAVHARGIVHRDLKPANVMLVERAGQQDFVKLVDFGVSKIQSYHMAGGDLTATGMVMGTPHYMAPEQARGAKNVDHRADLYALGAIVYRCLAGRVPYRGANYNQILAKILAQNPRPLKELRPDLPDGLVAVVEKAMARELDQRYQDAQAFAEELAAVSEIEVTISFVPPGDTELWDEMEDSDVIDGDATAPGMHSTEVLAFGQSDTVATDRNVAEGEDGTPTVCETPGRVSSVDAEDSMADSGDDSMEDSDRRPSSQSVAGSLSVRGSGHRASSLATTKAVSKSRRSLRLRRGVWAGALVFLAGLGLAGWALLHWTASSSSGPLPSANARLRFGLGEYMPKKEGVEVMRDLSVHLARQLGVEVVPETFDDPVSVGQHLVDGELDLAFISPLLYVKLKERFPTLRLVASIRSARSASYQGFIVGRVDRNIFHLKDLKGKTMCWVSPNSTSGYLMPYLLLLRAGLDPERLFAKAIMAGSHDRALALLAKGTCDAAAVFNMVYYRRQVIIPGGVRVVAPTGPIPQDVIVASPKMADSVFEWVTYAVLRSQEGRLRRHPLAGTFQITSFVPISDRVYDRIREALSVVRGHVRKERLRRSSAKGP